MMMINEWRVEPDTCNLSSNGKSVKISPRNMDVLVYLAQHKGEVISAEVLLDQFWHAASASDHAVHKAVASLRSALGDSAASPRFIKTLPKRGYCLIAAVSTVEALPTAPDSVAPEPEPGAANKAPEPLRPHSPEALPDHPPGAASGTTLPSPGGYVTQPAEPLPAPAASSMRRSIVLAATLLCLLLGAPALLKLLPETLIPEESGESAAVTTGNTLAILTPEYSDQLEPAQRQLVGALIDSLKISAGRIREMHLVEAESMSALQQLQAGALPSHVLSTSAYRMQTGVRLSINLVRVSDGTLLGANQFSLRGEELVALEEAVVPVVIEALGIHMDDARHQEMLDWGTRNTQAYKHFQKARFHAAQYNHKDWQLAITHYEESIEEDPAFVNAYLGMATALNNMAVYSRDARVDTLSLKLFDLNRQLALAVPNSPALETLKSIRLQLEGRNEWQQEQKYRQMIRDGTAPGYVYSRYALYLIGGRMYKEAAAYLELASQVDHFRISPNEAWNFQTQTLPPDELAVVKSEQLLDYPMHIGILGTAISSLAFVGDFEKALHFLERQIEGDEDGTRVHLSRVLVSAMAMRHNEETRAQVLEAVACSDLYSEDLLQDPDLAFNNGMLFFMQNDFERGAEYWRKLTPIDQRKLYTRLHAMEVFFPATIVRDARYAALLEELKVGVSWQRQLMEGVAELAEVTGIPLDARSQGYYLSGAMMLENNLWNRKQWRVVRAGSMGSGRLGEASGY